MGLNGFLERIWILPLLSEDLKDALINSFPTRSAWLLGFMIVERNQGSFVMVFFEKESVGKQLIMDVYVFYLVWQRKQLKDFQWRRTHRFSRGLEEEIKKISLEVIKWKIWSASIGWKEDAQEILANLSIRIKQSVYQNMLGRIQIHWSQRIHLPLRSPEQNFRRTKRTPT